MKKTKKEEISNAISMIRANGLKPTKSAVYNLVGGFKSAVWPLITEALEGPATPEAPANDLQSSIRSIQEQAVALLGPLEDGQDPDWKDPQLLVYFLGKMEEKNALIRELEDTQFTAARHIRRLPYSKDEHGTVKTLTVVLPHLELWENKVSPENSIADYGSNLIVNGRAASEAQDAFVRALPWLVKAARQDAQGQLVLGELLDTVPYLNQEATFSTKPRMKEVLPKNAEYFVANQWAVENPRTVRKIFPEWVSHEGETVSFGTSFSTAMPASILQTRICVAALRILHADEETQTLAAQWLPALTNWATSLGLEWPEL